MGHTCNPKQLFEWLIDTTIPVVFDKLLKKETDGDKKAVYIVFGFKAPYCYRYCLFSIVCLLFVAAWLDFWEAFPLQESYTCTSDAGLACFSSNASYFDLPLNCSNYLGKNDFYFECYKFTSATLPAAGTAFRVFGIGGASVTLITWAILTVSHIIKLVCCQIKVAYIIVVIGIQLAVDMAFIEIFIAFTTERPGTTKQLLSGFGYSVGKGVALLLAVLVSVMTPWWMFGHQKCCHCTICSNEKQLQEGELVTRDYSQATATEKNT